MVDLWIQSGYNLSVVYAAFKEGFYDDRRDETKENRIGIFV